MTIEDLITEIDGTIEDHTMMTEGLTTEREGATEEMIEDLTMMTGDLITEEVVVIEADIEAMMKTEEPEA